MRRGGPRLLLGLCLAAAAGAAPVPVVSGRAPAAAGAGPVPAAPDASGATSEADAALARACAWLWSRQAPDGAWRSETYGLLGSGQALTAFALDALLDAPADVAPRPAGGVERALDFLARHVDARGFLGLADPSVPEYPTYATAFALRCFVKAGRAVDRPLVLRLRRALAETQVGAPGDDLTPDHPATGGWGFGPWRPPGSPGHVDLGHTRHVLEALRLAGHDDPATWARAARFLAFLQRHPSDRRPQPPYGQPDARDAVPFDGGFYFSPVVLPASKGGVAEAPGGARYYRSYASATCDGLLALLAVGASQGDPRVRAARAWLLAHAGWERPAGIPAESHEGWADAVRCYHLAARAEAYAALGEAGWAAPMRAGLAGLVRPDGSVLNPDGALMKEDDPLLATTLAVVALSRGRELRRDDAARPTGACGAP